MIDTQAIRSKILDLAMRGKLTEQLPEDGTAEELYQQIQAKKHALIQDGKLKKEKSLSAISDEEKPYDLPRNWRWVRLKELCTKIVDGDHNPPAGVQETTDYLMLSAQNINKGKLSNLDNVRYLSASVFEEVNKRTLLEVDDVLLTIVGTIGRTCVYQGGYNICFQRSVAVISTLINSKYLKNALDIPFVQNFMEANATGAAQLGFYLNKLEKILIPLPPLAEQQRIVARIEQAFSVLDTIDTLQTKYADNLTVLKSKLIDAAIQGKLTEQLPEDGTAEELYQHIQSEKQALIKAGKIKKEKPLPEVSADEIPFEIPSNWKWVRLGNIGITVTGGTPSKSHPEYYGGKYPFFKPSDLDAGRHIAKASEYLTEAGKEVSRQLQQASILVCCIGSIGKAAIIDTDGTANQQINAFTPLDSDSDYLLYAIGSEAFQRQLDQGSRATTVSIINKSKFDNCVLPLPPLAEQKRIVAKLDEVLEMFSQTPPRALREEN